MDFWPKHMEQQEMIVEPMWCTEGFARFRRHGVDGEEMKKHYTRTLAGIRGRKS